MWLSLIYVILGVQLVMYISSALFLWSARRTRGRQSTLLLGYITLLFSVETIYVAVQARTVQLMYIDNRNYPGGPWQYFLATQNLPVNVMFYASLFVMTFLSDLLVVSCCRSCYQLNPVKLTSELSSFGAVGSSGVGQETLSDMLWLHSLL